MYIEITVVFLVRFYELKNILITDQANQKKISDVLCTPTSIIQIRQSLYRTNSEYHIAAKARSSRVIQQFVAW